jgi:hypothetical protein
MSCIKNFEFAIKAEGKIHPIICHEGTEGRKRYSCTLSLFSAPERVVN